MVPMQAGSLRYFAFTTKARRRKGSDRSLAAKSRKEAQKQKPLRGVEDGPPASLMMMIGPDRGANSSL